MAFTRTLDPPIDSTVEQETLTFDFGPDVVAGVEITSIQQVTCIATVNANLDANPQSRVLTSGAIIASPTTGQIAQAVAVLVGTMIGTVTYLIQCVVKTSDGQELSLWAYAPCITPA